MSPIPYTRLEWERRFLVDASSDWQSHVESYSKLFEDRYLDCGRLRLRRMEDSDTGKVSFKLTKKFPSSSSFSQPIVSIQLSSAEYDALGSLAGRDLVKRRHYHQYDGCVFSIDVLEGRLAGLILCETEAATLDALHEIRFPRYAQWEITEDPMFTGGALCRADRADVDAAIQLVKSR